MPFTPGENNNKWTQWAYKTHIVIFHLNICRKGSKVVSKKPNLGHLRDQAQKYDRQLINKGNIFLGRFDHVSIRQIIVWCIVQNWAIFCFTFGYDNILKMPGILMLIIRKKINLQHQTFPTCLHCLNNDLIFKKKSQQLKYDFATHKEMNANKIAKP